MKRLTTFLIFAVSITAAISCTEVGKNNQAANGDLKTSMADENKSDTETKKTENITAEVADDKPKSEKEANSPEALVEELYNQEDKENSPFFQYKNRELVDRFFAKNLADMIWKDAVETRDEIGALEFDPLYDAQDTEIADLKIGNAETKGDKATVPVTFLNFGEQQTITYLLLKEDGKWKIEDIKYNEDSLSNLYKKKDEPNQKEKS